jgi:hypothetical protein
MHANTEAKLMARLMEIQRQQGSGEWVVPADIAYGDVMSSSSGLCLSSHGATLTH